MAIFGKLAFDAGVGVVTLLFVRFAIAAPVLWALALRRAAPRGAPAAHAARRARARRDRLRDAGRALLHGARADGRLAAVAGPLHVPRLRHHGGDRARARDPEPAPRRRAAGVLRRARARAARRGRAARSTGSAPPWASAPRSPTPPTSSSPTAWREHRPLPLVRAGDDRRRHHVRRRRRRRPARSTRASRPRAGCGSRRSRSSRRSRRSCCSSPACKRVGPVEAAILSTLEPPTTVALAFVAFGETLTGVQLVGAALVLGAVVMLHTGPARGRLTPAAG